MDNLSVHRSKKVQEKANSIGIPLIFNAAWNPEGNPIEEIFVKVKHLYKKIKLNKIV